MTDDTRWSKTDWERFLRTEPGWWHDPKWGVANGKMFRRWAVSLWRAAQARKRREKQGAAFRKSYCPGRHYNTALKAKRLRG